MLVPVHRLEVVLGTFRALSPTQGGPHPSSDLNLVPPQFKNPGAPPLRTVVATTRMEMYLRHTSQDVMVTSPPPGSRRHRASSLSTSTDSRIPPPPQTSPRSSVQQWLDALDTQASPPPPTSAMLASQPVSMYSGVSSSMLLGYSTSQMAPQRVRSSCHSQFSRRSHFSTTSATVIQREVYFLSKVTDSLAHLAEWTRMDAAHREDAMHHQSLAREQCHRIQASERERAQRGSIGAG